MLEIKYIREHKEEVIQSLQTRQVKDAAELVESFLSLDKQSRAAHTALDTASAELHKITKNIEQLLKQDATGMHAEIESLKLQTQKLKADIKELTGQRNQYDQELQAALCALPNLSHPGVPVGVAPNHNEVVYQNEVPLYDLDQQRSHWDLAVSYDIIDFASGSKITGAGFPVYRGKGAKLQRALINFFLDEAEKAGYEEIQPPILINRDSAYGTGQLPDKEGQMYQLADKGLYLAPTTEVLLTNLYRDQILPAAELPIKNVGYTPCFRKEAGSWGSHVRGLNRLHQFDKVELVEIRRPEESYRALQLMRSHIEDLLEKLMLPYRVLKLCSGDLGFTAAFTYDFEVLSVGQGRWLEVSSTTNFETYQATRMRLRYRTPGKKTQWPHTLNGSALALPRIMAALLEYNQRKNSIKVPHVLRPYTGFDRIH
ncbi:MAG: serine--tRNA ligase [Bacteroidota bacterium]